MHEFLLASMIVRTALNEGAKHRARRIKKVYLSVGDFAMINKEQIMFWVKEGLKIRTGFVCDVVINSIPVRIKCNECGYEGRPAEFHFGIAQCPYCGSLDCDLIEGTECKIEKIEIEI